VAQVLISHNFEEVYPLLGGFDTWRQAGYPVEAK
jgi:rhodanese-related sulfurtransferase